MYVFFKGIVRHEKPLPQTVVALATSKIIQRNKDKRLIGLFEVNRNKKSLMLTKMTGVGMFIELKR
mgnify:CR=1 FL=1